MSVKSASRRRRSGFVRLLTVVLLCGGLLAAEGGVAVAGTRKQLSEARERYKRIQVRLDQLVKAHADAQSKLTVTNRRIAETRGAIKKTEADAASLQDQLRTRVRLAYRMGGLGFFEFLLSADSFRDFSLRVMTLERQSARDEELVLDLRRLRAELDAKERDLEWQKKEQAKEKAALAAQVKSMNLAWSEASRLVKDLEDRLSREEIARLFRVGGGRDGGRGRVFGLSACPAAGPHAFSNDWGAPRGGGRRRHKGNDVFAPMGSPAAAVVSGRVSRLRSGGNGGLAVYLWGDDGNEYYYAHMSGFKASQGQRVSVGQTIAAVGNTGNARGGAPHIHFEIHPGGGAAVNPYHSLIRVC